MKVGTKKCGTAAEWNEIEALIKETLILTKEWINKRDTLVTKSTKVTTKESISLLIRGKEWMLKDQNRIVEFFNAVQERKLKQLDGDKGSRVFRGMPYRRGKRKSSEPEQPVKQSSLFQKILTWFK